MAESTRRTCRKQCARGVNGSSQGRPSFTVRMRKPPRARCAKLPPRRLPYSADGRATGPQDCWRSEVKSESFLSRNVIRPAAVVAVMSALVLGPGCRKKKYENPITKDTSGNRAKSKRARADSWYREGGSHGLAQAEAVYKDFILFSPQLEEAAEA